MKLQVVHAVAEHLAKTRPFTASARDKEVELTNSWGNDRVRGCLRALLPRGKKECSMKALG